MIEKDQFIIEKNSIAGFFAKNFSCIGATTK